jgi:ABC-type methionine transport system ATPase subunit
MAEIDINLTARREAVDEPWLWRLGREFDVKVNIVKANIDTDQVRLEGPLEEIQRAIAWLMTTGLHVEALERAVGA